MSDTLLASASRILWRTIKSHGLDPDQIFIDAGLDPEKINVPSARFPVENARKTWALAAKNIEDACFGLTAGENWLPTDLHALGYAFLSSTTLETAINRIVRYNEIVDRVINFASATTDQHLVLT